MRESARKLLPCITCSHTEAAIADSSKCSPVRASCIVITF